MGNVLTSLNAAREIDERPFEFSDPSFDPLFNAKLCLLGSVATEELKESETFEIEDWENKKRSTCEAASKSGWTDWKKVFGVIVEIASEGNLPDSFYAVVDTLNNEYALGFSDKDWNTLCTTGGLNGHASSVLEACNLAVTMSPENGDYFDSRGLARALAGDTENAIEDFENAIELWRAVDQDDKRIGLREKIIEDLKAGSDPFDKNLLKTLLNEPQREEK